MCVLYLEITFHVQLRMKISRLLYTLTSFYLFSTPGNCIIQTVFIYTFPIHNYRSHHYSGIYFFMAFVKECLEQNGLHELDELYILEYQCKILEERW